MTKLEETETIEKCKGTEELSKGYYEKECERLFEENFNMKIIIETLIEELKRRPQYYD